MLPTRFSELWDAYCSASDEHKADRRTLLSFLPQFINQLITQLGWSSDLVEIGASTENFLSYERAMSSLNDCLVPLSNKGYWQFWMKFTLANQSPSSAARAPKTVGLIVPIALTHNNGIFYVTIAVTEPKSFQIVDVNSEAFFKLSNFVVAAMYRKIQNGLIWDLEVSEKLKQVVL